MADLTSPSALALIDVAIADNRASDALGQLRELPPDIRHSEPVMVREAELLGRLGEYERAIELYRKLIAIRPDTAGLWVALADALRILGRGEEAVAALRHAIAVDPDYAHAWWVLSDLKDFRFDDSDVAAMTQSIDRQASDATRIPLHFALGKAFEDRGEATRAFDHYAAANAFRAASFRRNRIGIAAKAEQMVATMTADLYEQRAGWGHDSDAPIFIVGVQRSGSTLVEQILASHPSIEGTSELPIMPQILREVAGEDRPSIGALAERVATLDRDQVRDLGQRYLDRAVAFRHSDRPRFVDKHPGNWSNIGLIRLILPNARIIDARRHPMATGWSNFKQDYGATSFFSYDLATMGHYYRHYLRLVSHFEQIATSAVYRVVNERLIADFEPQVRALLDHVGVAFDPACLDFHRTERAVRTPSAAQVRRPINRQGVDSWRLFEPMLEPLKRALGPSLDGWDRSPGDYRDEEL
ncbi:MAG: sulfotransferase [Sphingomicrobium sp.]